MTTGSRDAQGCGVVIPVKAFHDAKHRLAPALDSVARARLARAMASTVVDAADGLPVLVVCDDAEVAEWATAVGAEVVWCPDRGLDGAVADGVATLAERGVARAVVAHADLPHARSLRGVCGPVDPAEPTEPMRPTQVDAPASIITLVPDRREDGTNVIVLPTDCGFRFAYGPGSFHRHLAEADRVGLTVRVVRDPTLTWDVDVPADLERPPWAAEAAAPGSAVE